MIRSVHKAGPFFNDGLLLHKNASRLYQNPRGVQCGHVVAHSPSKGRAFTKTSHSLYQQKHRANTFRFRLRRALRDTPVQWRPIPVGLGVAFLGVYQFYRIQRNHAASNERNSDEQNRHESLGQTTREQLKKSGPWQVKVLSTLPLKAISRWWGKFNELEIPYYLRVPGFKLYSWIFGVNLSEVAEPDLHKYPNLAQFFYRELKTGVRPLDPNPHALLSPADGTVLQFGTIDNGEVEQVKGITYSVDSLLGAQQPIADNVTPAVGATKSGSESVNNSTGQRKDTNTSQDRKQFATINDIPYTVPDLLSGSRSTKDVSNKNLNDQSTTPRSSSEFEVSSELLKDKLSWWASQSTHNPTALHYCVVYLAPGDYHRFHSPASWVVERRRHFAGELYSVSPYLQKRLPGLFTLNERVVLLGKWRWGFFSMIPVGATNVGSIKINFDRELRTNSLTNDTAADKAAEEALERGEAYHGFVEATYEGASTLMKGFALKRGEEMGGFQLGSTIVLIFEAPESGFHSNGSSTSAKDELRWTVERNQKVKVGQALALVEPARQ